MIPTLIHNNLGVCDPIEPAMAEPSIVGGMLGQRLRMPGGGRQWIPISPIRNDHLKENMDYVSHT